MFKTNQAMKRIWIILMSAATLALSCNKPGDPQPDTPQIVIPQESQAIFSQGITFEAGTSALSRTVKFSSNVAWSADVADTKASAWLKVSPPSGAAGDVTLTISAPKYSNETDRAATVTIKAGTESKSFPVKQKGIPHVAVTSVSLSTSDLSLPKGSTGTLVAVIAPANATNKEVEWRCDKPEFATVDKNGKVTAMAEGKAVVTVRTVEGGFEANCTILVVKDNSEDFGRDNGGWDN